MVSGSGNLLPDHDSHSPGLQVAQGLQHSIEWRGMLPIIYCDIGSGYLGVCSSITCKAIRSLRSNLRRTGVWPTKQRRATPSVIDSHSHINKPVMGYNFASRILCKVGKTQHQAMQIRKVCVEAVYILSGTM